MPKKGENISLTSYDDLFETDESRAESQLERVQNIPVRELIPSKITRLRCSMMRLCCERRKASRSMAFLLR